MAPTRYPVYISLFYNVVGMLPIVAATIPPIEDAVWRDLSCGEMLLPRSILSRDGGGMLELRGATKTFGATIALRATDLVFDHNIDGYDYAIILPNTTAQDGTVAAQKLADNLTRSLTSVADDLAPRIAVQSLYEPDTKELPKAPAKPRKAASAGTRRRKNEADD